MRKIIVITMITLDGVMQAPGGPEEDPSNDFKYGGWTAPYSADNGGEFFQKNMKPAEYLLGRKTYEIFKSYWPDPEHAKMWPWINKGMKYVFSNTLDKSDWENTTFLKSVDDIKKLKKSDGADLNVWGSGKLIQLLMKHDLVDEFRLVTYPLTLGQGQKLFADLPAPRPGVFFVYAILCDDDSIYIGQTQNLSERWNKHVSGTAAEHTKRHKPLEMIHYEEYFSRQMAVNREQDLKTGFGRKWLKREFKAGRTRQAGGTIPAAFKLLEGKISPTGVIMANYKRAGEVKTGTVGA